MKKSLAETHPEVAAQWHPTKNDELTVEDVTYGSGKKVWWVCDEGHEWEAKINNRTANKSGCPYCAGQRVTKDFSLAAVNPKLAREWHPALNGALSPERVSPQSHRAVWWLCEDGHYWKARIQSRHLGSGCPYCSGRKVGQGNSLADLSPELAADWNDEKNEELSPHDVTVHSSKKVWWKCSQGHEWAATVNDRSRGSGCPFCSGRQASESNNLSLTNPDLAAQWHPRKNNGLTPQGVTPRSAKKVWWRCDKGHEWQATVKHRAVGDGCPYCAGQLASPEYNLAALHPKLMREWHTEKNRGLKPQEITPGSNQKVWWRCSRGHEWKAVVGSRTRGIGCPYCTSQTSRLEIRLYCELRTVFPEIIWRAKVDGNECDLLLPQERIAIEVDGKYWHSDRFSEDLKKNKKLHEHGIDIIRLREDGLQLTQHSDITFSKNTGHLKVVISLLRALKGLISNQEALEGISAYLDTGVLANPNEYRRILTYLPGPIPEESFKAVFPSISEEWDQAKNAPLTPEMFTPHSGKRVWWRCSSGHSWQASFNQRSKGHGCPYCSGKKVGQGNSLGDCLPELAREWHEEMNGELTPFDVLPGTTKKVWWKCPEGHVYDATPAARSRGRGCPYCSGNRVGQGNSLTDRYPELAEQWHPTRNGDLSPCDVTPGSGKFVWWQCSKGHEWQQKIIHRKLGSSECPICSGRINWRSCKIES